MNCLSAWLKNKFESSKIKKYQKESRWCSWIWKHLQSIRYSDQRNNNIFAEIIRAYKAGKIANECQIKDVNTNKTVLFSRGTTKQVSKKILDTDNMTFDINDNIIIVCFCVLWFWFVSETSL